MTTDQLTNPTDDSKILILEEKNLNLHIKTLMDSPCRQ